MPVLRVTREQGAAAVALAILTVVGWWWLVRAPMPMPGAAGVHDAQYAWLTLVMWLVMMVAMMTPSVAPTVLLFTRVARRAADGGKARIAAFLGGYFSAWLAFSIVATLLQIAWIDAGAIDAMGVSLLPWLTAALLGTAALYQLTPLKGACLRQCRAPAEFLASEYRPGPRGAWIMGTRHGIYCLGCCWALMLLLFVGGVMDLRVVFALSLLVLLEKATPYGRAVRLTTAAALLVAAAWVLR